jgi:hypothetical protein
MVALLVSLSSASATLGISAESTIQGFSSILFSALLFAQTAAGANHTAQTLAASTNTAATKPTANQQRGRRLLETALAEAKSLQPEMHAFVVWKIAEAYKNADPGKSEALLREAFVASLSIEDIAAETPGGVCQDLEGCGIKVWLQRETLKSMTSSSEIEDLLLQARPQVQNSVIALMIPRYLAQKNLAKVRQLIISLADQGEYPYESAMDLIFALPTGSPERGTIFSEAVNAYRVQSEGVSLGTGYIGLPGMVSRFWRDVPPEMAEDALMRSWPGRRRQMRDQSAHTSHSRDLRGASRSIRSINIVYSSCSRFSKSWTSPRQRACFTTTRISDQCSTSFLKACRRCNRTTGCTPPSPESLPRPA